MPKISTVSSGIPLEAHHRYHPTEKEKYVKQDFRKGSGVVAYPFYEMKVGDSFLLCDLEPSQLAAYAQILKCNINKRKAERRVSSNYQIAVRYMSPNSIRVWRTR